MKNSLLQGFGVSSIFKERPFINSLTSVTPEAYFSHFHKEIRLIIDEVMMFKVLLEF